MNTEPISANLEPELNEREVTVTKRLNVRVPKVMAEQVSRLAKERDTTKSEIIRQALHATY